MLSECLLTPGWPRPSPLPLHRREGTGRVGKDPCSLLHHGREPASVQHGPRCARGLRPNLERQLTMLTSCPDPAVLPDPAAWLMD